FGWKRVRRIYVHGLFDSRPRTGGSVARQPAVVGRRRRIRHGSGPRPAFDLRAGCSIISRNVSKRIPREMAHPAQGRFTAGPLTFIVRHELWDGNIHDHPDQGVVIDVAAEVTGKKTALLRFN